MAVDTLLSRLDGVKQTGADRWRARCPSHGSKGLSLAIREVEDGRVLVHCFAGCDVETVLSSIGMTAQDMFPERLNGHHYTPERRPFPAADVLRCIAFEALVVVTAGAALLDGEHSHPGDRERLVLAVGRIQGALDAAGVRT